MILEMCSDYNNQLKTVEELLKNAKETIETYNKKTKNDKEEINRKRNQPDEDGWITVTKEGNLI